MNIKCVIKIERFEIGPSSFSFGDVVIMSKRSGVDEAFETLLFAVFGKELIDEFRRRRPAGFKSLN